LERLQFLGFRGSEGFSQLFHHQLDFRAAEGEPIDPDQLAARLLGKEVAFEMMVEPGKTRAFHGIAARFDVGDDERHLQVELMPRLWLLGLSSDCRTFAGKDVKTITQTVLRGAGFTDADFLIKVNGEYPRYEHCVQYRETDLNFVLRLWEQEGVTFFFEMDAGRHRLVLTDDPGVLGAGGARAVARRAPATTEAWETTGAIHAWRQRRELRSARYALVARNWREPGAELALAAETEDRAPSHGELYDLGEYTTHAQGKRYAQLRMQEEEASRRVGHGAGSLRDFAPGSRFQFAPPAAAAHGGLDALLSTAAPGLGAAAGAAPCFLVTTVHHELHEADRDRPESYHNTFTAIPDGEAFCPPRLAPRPVIQGVHCGIVVGPDGRAQAGEGDEVHLDAEARVRVRLYWDRADAAVEPIYARVGQPWAGRGFGAWFVPRIGQEVLVCFEEGDPDRPLVVGSVYGGGSLPFSLAAAKTACGLRTHSTRDSARNHGNEFSFNDGDGHEEVRLVAQKDLRTHVKNDECAVVDRDQTRFVMQDQIDRIGRNRRTLIQGSRSESVGQDGLLEVVGALSEKVGGAFGLDAGGAVTIKTGSTLVIEAQAQISLVVGGNHITIGPDGVRINGTLIRLNCSGGSPAHGQAITVPALQVPQHPQPPVRR
jgi:type VI secretion system secreted protein VgrG